MFARVRRSYLRWRLGPSIIVVSGLPRSGTSMMMNMLGSSGLRVATDLQRVADEDNPRGYFEHEQVKGLDKAGDKSWLGEYRGQVIKIISFLLPDLPDDYHYKVIFMLRDLDEVVASQNKMLLRRGEDPTATADKKMKQNYRLHLRKVDYLLEERLNVDLLKVDYRKALDGPGVEAERVRRFVGMPLDVAAMVQAVDSRLYRNRR